MRNPSAGGAGFFRKTLFLFTFALVVAVGGLVYQLFRGDGTEVRELLIPRGSTIASVVQTLQQEDVIRSPLFFKLLLRATNGAHKVRAGEFRFKRNMRPIDALFVLYYDQPIVHQVTIPEGWNARQIAKSLADAKLGSEEKFVRLMLSKEAPAKYKLNVPSLEGFLYPDTYAFSRVDGEERIVDHLVQQFLRKFDKELREEVKRNGFTLEQFVTLASIVEKETGVDSERALVASVFHNRLRKKMRLQSDPTTIYGIANFNGNLTRAHLREQTPYNTYAIPALPPGPIASPGMATLLATLRPAKSNYLYFVATGKGGHVFSETYGQHAQYVNTYQRKGRPLPPEASSPVPRPNDAAPRLPANDTRKALKAPGKSTPKKHR